MSTHAQIHIAQTATDGAVRIQVMYDARSKMDMIDFTPICSRPIGMNAALGRTRRAFDVGETSVTNQQLMDLNNNGMSILRKVWTDPNGIFKGTYQEGYAGCMKFMQTLSNGGYLGPNVHGNPQFDELASTFYKYIDNKFSLSPSVEPYSEKDVPIRHRTVISENLNENRIIEFPITSDDPTRINPPRPPFNMDVFGTQFQDGANTIAGDPNPLTTIEEEALFSDINVESTGVNLAGFFNPGPFSREQEFCRRSLNQRCTGTGGQDLTEIALARVKGVLSTIEIITQGTVQAIGIAGAALGAVFVILDLWTAIGRAVRLEQLWAI